MAIPLGRRVLSRSDRCGDRAATHVVKHDEKACADAGTNIAGSPQFPTTEHFPATWMMNNSPNPASKISFGGIRKSLQLRIVA
jgi:hypothetical protein